MGGLGSLPMLAQLSPNPIIRAKQQQDLVSRALRSLTGGAGFQPPQGQQPQFNFPGLPVPPTGQPAHPAAQPAAPSLTAVPAQTVQAVQAAQAAHTPATPAGSTPQTAPDMRTLLSKDLQHQLAPAADPTMPTYTPPKQQSESPLQLLVEGLGALFAHGGASQAIVGGVGQREKQYQDQYASDVDQAQNAYNRAMTAYDRETTARESRIQHDITGIDAVDKEAETAREHRVHDSAVQRGLDIKARQVSNQQSEAAEKLHASLYMAAQRLGVDKSRIAEQYWAQGQRSALGMMQAGMRSQTALNVAQLGATSRFVQAMWTGQNRKEITQMQQSGMWDRLQALQQNENARGAMTQLGLLIRQANNPKDPKAAAAAAQLEAQMGDASSPIGQLMQQFQTMGIMSAPVGDVMQSEIDAETPMPGAGAYPAYGMGGGFIGEPAPQTTELQPIMLNNGTPGTPPTMPQGNDVQAWLREIFGNQYPGAGGAGAAGAGASTQTGAASSTPQIPAPVLESARAWMSHYMGQEGPTAQNAEAAFKTMVEHGVVKGSAAEINALHRLLVGTGAPNPKNSVSPPSLALPQVP